MKRNFYHILGIGSLSGSEKIREAYKEAVIRFHPDKNHSPGAAEEFIAIQKAYEILNDPIRKIDYDAQIQNEPSLFPISVKLESSRSTIAQSHEPQLLYGLFEIDCTIQPEQTVNAPLAVAMVVDTSTSMTGERLDSVKRSLVAFIKQLNHDDFFCVIGFNDRAQVVVPLTQAGQFDPESEPISRMGTTGGTEVYQGLYSAFGNLMNKEVDHCRKHMVIFTDGNTYGDESDCLLLAKDAFDKKIVISAYGIGNDWNDIFLDRLTAITGGETRFVNSSRDMERFLKSKLLSFGRLFSQSVKLTLSHRSDIKVNYAFRLKPEPAPVEIADEYVLGNVPFNGKLAVLFEFLIPPVDGRKDFIRLGQGFVTVESPYWDSQIRSFYVYQIGVSAIAKDDKNSVEIVNALAVLTMYRIQEKARQDVADGKPELAIEKLNYLIKHLNELGHFALAQEVNQERNAIMISGKYNISGDKTIKYGTRALLLPEN